MIIRLANENDNAGLLYRKLGARHYKDFTGKMSQAEKLMWNSLDIFA